MTGSPVWHPFTQHDLEPDMPLVERAKDAVLITRDGQAIVDGISSWWVTTHGHCHPRITAAIAAQAQRLDQIIFAGFTHEPAEQLAVGLRELMPDALEYVFYSDSGSTSVEVALKMALGHWLHHGEPKHRIIVMEHGYHGDTIGAMSVGARGVFNAAYSPLLFDVQRIPFPASGAEQACLDALEANCRAGAAAFLVEPLILGAGGMLIYPAWVLREMRRICAEHRVLFVADEVMTGWGRTGTLLACEQADIVPDLLCLSKGLTGGSLPLAVTMATAEIFDSHLSKDRSRQFFHSSSYTANPLSCAAALANLAIWREEPVLERIRTLSERQAGQLERLSRLPGAQNLRQIGTIIGLDVAADEPGYLSELGPVLREQFVRAGALIRPLGNTIYLMPPYCITDGELAFLHQCVAEAIETKRSGRR